jgi:hypothetical protein
MAPMQVGLIEEVVLVVTEAVLEGMERALQRLAELKKPLVPGNS